MSKGEKLVSEYRYWAKLAERTLRIGPRNWESDEIESKESQFHADLLAYIRELEAKAGVQSDAN